MMKEQPIPGVDSDVSQKHRVQTDNSTVFENLTFEDVENADNTETKTRGPAALKEALSEEIELTGRHFHNSRPAKFHHYKRIDLVI